MKHLLLPAVLVVVSSFRGTEAGIWPPRVPSLCRGPALPSDRDFADVEFDQALLELEKFSLEDLQEEAGEYRRSQIKQAVARVCSRGIHSTLIVGGAVLACRLLPILLGNGEQGGKEVESPPPLLLKEGGDHNIIKSLPASSSAKLITQGGVEADGIEGGAHNNGWDMGVGDQEGRAKGEGGVGVGKQVVVSHEEDDEGAIVVITKGAAARREAWRQARPLLRLVALPLALLGMAWAVLAPVLAGRVSGEEEFMFGDMTNEKWGDKDGSSLSRLFGLPEFLKQGEDEWRRLRTFDMDSLWLKAKSVQRPLSPKDLGEEEEEDGN